MNDQVGKIKTSLKIFSSIFKPYILHSAITVHEVYRFILYIKAWASKVLEVFISNFPSILFSWFKNQEKSNVWIWKYCYFEFFEVILMNNLSCDYPKYWLKTALCFLKFCHTSTQSFNVSDVWQLFSLLLASTLNWILYATSQLLETGISTYLIKSFWLCNVSEHLKYI